MKLYLHSGLEMDESFQLVNELQTKLSELEIKVMNLILCVCFVL